MIPLTWLAYIEGFKGVNSISPAAIHIRMVTQADHGLITMPADHINLPGFECRILFAA